MKRWLLTALVALLVPLLVRGQAPDEKKLDEIVPRAFKTFEAPGLAIVIVKGDQVVYRKGAGVRELGSPEAITEDTVFQIASCTKAFLAMLLAISIGDGLIDWDDPVHKHVPYFRLSDPLADRNITIRDLLCHRTGLSRCVRATMVEILGKETNRVARQRRPAAIAPQSPLLLPFQRPP